MWCAGAGIASEFSTFEKKVQSASRERAFVIARLCPKIVFTTGVHIFWMLKKNIHSLHKKMPD